MLVLNDQQTGWTDGPKLPEARVAGAAVFDGSRILYAGGNARKADRHHDGRHLHSGEQAVPIRKPMPMPTACRSAVASMKPAA